MITVTIVKGSDGSYKGFHCIGHAEYARPGKPDVICAAVSAWVTGTVNALEALAHEELKCVQEQKTGFLKCDFMAALQEKSVFLMDSMVFALEQISDEYGKKYLQVKIEEV